MKGKIIAALLAGFIAGGICGYLLKPSGGPDTWSGATKQETEKKDKDEVRLPEAGDTYEVLGVIPGLKNFAVKYDDTVYRGGEFTAVEGGKYLKDKGIQTVISITPTDLERLICEKYGIDLVELPFEKDPGVPGETIDRLLDLLKNGKTPVYIHCHGGSHRGGLFGAVYRIGILGWDAEKAKKEYEALGGDPDNKDRDMFEKMAAMVKERK